MILIISASELPVKDKPLQCVDIRDVLSLIPDTVVRRMARIEVHRADGWIKVIKDVTITDRPTGYLPKHQANGFGESDRVAHLGVETPPNYGQLVITTPVSAPLVKGWVAALPVTDRQLEL